MRLFFKRWLDDKWVLLIIVFGGFFFVTIGQGGTTNKPQGNTYNESLTIGVPQVQVFQPNLNLLNLNLLNLNPLNLRERLTMKV